MPLDPNWDPEEALRILNDPLEKSINDGETKEETTKRILEFNAPLVTSGLVHMAINSKNESIRLRASTYIIDRLLGRPTDAPLNVDKDLDPLHMLIKDISREVPGVKG